MIRLFARWAAPLLVVVALSVDVQATTIGMNFDGNGGNGGTAFDPGLVTGTAGAVPQANWNNLDTANGGPTTVVDSSGTPTGVSVTWGSGNTWSNDEADASAAGNGGTPTQDALLLNNYLDGGSSSLAATVTVSNIPYASYSLYVYTLHDGGKGGTLSDYTVNGITQDVMVGGPDTVDFNNSGYVQATPTTEGDYVLFSGLSGDFMLSADLTANGNNRSPINGIEIVPDVPVPEPSSIALLGVGIAGVLLAARRRKDERQNGVSA